MASAKNSWEIKQGGQEMAVMVQAGGQNFNNNNSGWFSADSWWS